LQENWFAKYGADFSGARTFNGNTSPYKIPPTRADMHLSFLYCINAKSVGHLNAYREGVDYVAKTSAGAGQSGVANPGLV